jgi:very-short-patch-repair endonuclease
MQRTTVVCKQCGREISKSNITKHENACKGKELKHSYTLTHDGLTCQFCGKECKNKNSLCNHERLCKQNPNRQQSVGFTKFNAARELGLVTSWNSGLTAETDARVAKQAKALTEHYITNKAYWTGKKHAEETKQKISKSRKQYLLKHPDQIPYLLNHSSQESYPEMYFTELFKGETINLHKEYYCLGYFLDFCDPIKKIDIEIDGEQHYVDSRIVEHDKIRNAVLEKAGWTVFRVRWAEYKTMTDEQKHNIITQIKSLLA